MKSVVSTLTFFRVPCGFVSRSGYEKSLNSPLERGHRGVLSVGKVENKQTDNSLLRKAGMA